SKRTCAPSSPSRPMPRQTRPREADMIDRRQAMLGAAAFAAAAPAFAQSGSQSANRNAMQGPVASRRTGSFNGVKVEYDAIVGPVTVNNAQGKPGAKLVSTSYITTKQTPGRPVIFVFNGGPISASSILHMGAMGPKRLAMPDDITVDPKRFKLVDN